MGLRHDKDALNGLLLHHGWHNDNHDHNHNHRNFFTIGYVKDNLS